MCARWPSKWSASPGLLTLRPVLGLECWAGLPPSRWTSLQFTSLFREADLLHFTEQLFTAMNSQFFYFLTSVSVSQIFCFPDIRFPRYSIKICCGFSNLLKHLVLLLAYLKVVFLSANWMTRLFKKSLGGHGGVEWFRAMPWLVDRVFTYFFFLLTI